MCFNFFTKHFFGIVFSVATSAIGVRKVSVVLVRSRTADQKLSELKVSLKKGRIREGFGWFALPPVKTGSAIRTLCAIF